MNQRIEGALATAAALLVLFSAMLDPRVSVALSIAALGILAIYKFVWHDGQ
jgi:hypothetical protein